MIYLNDHIDDLNVEIALEEVSPQRRERVLRIKVDRDRKRSLAAYLLLKEGLQKEYGIVENPIFEYGPEGKPVLAGHPDIHFSISHAGHVALCVIDNEPVGADVEVLRRIKPQLISFTMNEEEQGMINAAPDAGVAFLELWTQKEAVLKLAGMGIRRDMTGVLADVTPYSIETVNGNDYVYSIARWGEKEER